MNDEFLLESFSKRIDTPSYVGSDGIYYGNPWSYCGGVRVSDLRSGRDGPATGLADYLCGLRRDTA